MRVIGFFAMLILFASMLLLIQFLYFGKIAGLSVSNNEESSFQNTEQNNKMQVQEADTSQEGGLSPITSFTVSENSRGKIVNFSVIFISCIFILLQLDFCTSTIKE